MIIDKKKGVSALDRIIEWSLYVLIFSLPFSKTLIEICIITAIICWMSKKLLLGKDGLRLPDTYLNLPMLIFFLISFLSIFWSTHPGISISAFFRKLSEYILLYFIVVEAVREKRIVGNIIKALMLSVFFMCANGIFQKFTGYDFVRNYPLFSLQHMTSAFKFPNGFSAWLLIVSFPFICLTFFYKEDLRVRLTSLGLTVLTSYCLFHTYTRGAIISFILAVFLMFLLKGGKIYYAICAILIIGIAVIALVLPEDAGPYKGIRYYIGMSELVSGISSQHRIRMWTTGWKMFMDRPLLGQGLNTFMANYERFRIPEEYGIWYAHNCFLQIGAETGIFGLLAFMWMILRMTVTSIKSWKFIEDRFLRYVYLGLFCGIVAFLIHSAVETNLYVLQLAVLFYLSLGLLTAVKKMGLSYGKA